MIRSANSSDALAIAEIYNHYIQNTVVTFEESPVNESDIQERIEEAGAEHLPYLVISDDLNRVQGYAYASKWKGRCAYRYTVEVTIYLSPAATGEGLGTKLYEDLFNRLKKASYHVAIAGISLPNPASIALHEKFKMRKVAHFKEVGHKFDAWVDVAYYQCEL